MRFVVLATLLLPVLLVVAIAAGPVGPALLLAVGAFALVWVIGNALIGIAVSGASLIWGHRSR